MTEKMRAIDFNILGKEYKIACPQDEGVDLLNTAQLLDEKMREIQNAGKVIGTDRIAVMAALNIIHDLNMMQKQNKTLSYDLEKQLINLRHKIEHVLSVS